MFLLSEGLRIGRAYALLTLFSIFSVFPPCLVRLAEAPDVSALFDVCEMCLLPIIKVLVCICTEAHLGHLEAARDEGRSDTSQSEFLGTLFPRRGRGPEGDQGSQR